MQNDKKTTSTCSSDESLQCIINLRSTSSTGLYDTLIVKATLEEILRRIEDVPPYHLGGSSSMPNMGVVNSSNVMHHEEYLRKSSSLKNVITRIPPSYSSVLKYGPPVPSFESVPFIVRLPPPSYAEAHGTTWDVDDSASDLSVDSASLGPNATYVPCPRCRTLVMSDIRTERSHMAYISSLVMCVCMCWPCCLLPWCIKTCRNTYHFCPFCHYYLGSYRPC